MKDSYTAILKQVDSWWVGWVEEIPGVNCQEESKSELLQSLQVSLREALELNRHDALDAAGEGYQEEQITYEA